MSRYHAQILQLLESEHKSEKDSSSNLSQWAKANNIAIPSSFLEWAELDGENILGKYSNNDWFWFDKPKIITIENGIRGLLFNTENQGNFEKIVQLDNGDDPPVFTSWIGDSPWIMHADKFSDCIFAQIFDWQYLLEFDSQNPNYKEIGYYGSIKIKSNECLGYLRENFTESVTTKMIVEGEVFVQNRFNRSLKERITVFSSENGSGEIQITGEQNLVINLESELVKALDKLIEK